MTVLLLALTLVAGAADIPGAELTLREAAEAAGVAWPPPRFWISVDKSDHELVAWSGETALKRYRVGLGDPEGDKLRRGDMKTPNGTFHVVTRNDRSSFHLFLGLDYPNAEDAERGLRAGLVTEAQAQAIKDAVAKGRKPNWETRLGGAIGIHGGGSSADWTLGCIAVENHEIEELWEVARIGTGVVVEE